MASSPDPEVVKELVGYFLRNPLAADTLEGIARWRLLDEKVYREVMETSRAVAWLVECGILEEISTSAAEPIYRLNASGRPLAEELMRTGDVKTHAAGAKDWKR